jgi:thiamine-monophosphate kinase
VRRAGAKPGDRVFVSGTIGDAALGLALRNGGGTDWKLKDAQRQHLLSRYLLPQPRNALAEAVRTHASAAMDVSDGLAGDFAKLCRASQVAADIDVTRVPLSDAAKAVLAAAPAMIETALTGGDDYEIVCTVPPAKADSFRAAAQAVNVPVSEIGQIAAGEGARFLGADGNALSFKRASFSHF